MIVRRLISSSYDAASQTMQFQKETPILLDTSAWIEFFIKSTQGEKVKNMLENLSCFTFMTSIAEISGWALKENRKPEELMQYIKNLTHIIDMTENIALKAGTLNIRRKETEKNWGMMDSFILAAALVYNLRILTKDRHFKNLPNVEML